MRSRFGAVQYHLHRLGRIFLSRETAPVGTRSWRWRGYVMAILIHLGYDNSKDRRIILALIIRLLRKSGFDFQLANHKLALRKFSGSNEKRQTTEAIREVVCLKAGKVVYRPQARMVNLGESDVAIEDIRADPGLTFILDESTANLMAAISNFADVDRKILTMRSEDKRFREISSSTGMSLGYVCERFHELCDILATQLALSESNKRR
jgi:hypothetical protein